MKGHRLLIAFLPFSACGRPSVSTLAGAAPLPAYESLSIDSRALGERRPINVHLPAAYRESGRRFPVLYMPDGGVDEDFPHVVRAVDSMIASGAIPPMIVVGVPNTERRRDLTGPTRSRSDSAVAPHVGGSEAFRRFFRQELIPTIDARYATTRERAIIGESLAGLFVVETLLREPLLFDRYIAFDPSLWWNGGALVDSTATLLSWFTPAIGAKRLYVASSRDDIRDETARLAEVLESSAPKELWWRYERRPDLTHGTIFAALESRGLVSAFTVSR